MIGTVLGWAFAVIGLGFGLLAFGAVAYNGTRPAPVEDEEDD